MKGARRGHDLDMAIAVAVLLVVAATHFPGVITSFDSRWSIPTARSLLREGNTDLDEYPALLAANHDYAIERIGGRSYSIYPIGASLLAAPVVYVLDAAGAKLKDGKTEKLIACLITGLTAAVLYLVARRSLGVKGALVLTFVFAFCTAAWSTASRALWQHGPSMLMLTLALWLIVLARDRPWVIQLVSLPLAFSYVARPTNAIAIALLSVFVLVWHRRYALVYLLWALPVGVPFLLFSWSVYHAALPPYYSAAKIGHGAAFAEALLGTLVSPGRGLFVFSPVLLLSISGAWSKLRRGGEPLDGVLAGIVLVHWIAISSFSIWWGGHSFGYRLFSDMVPYLVYFLIPVVAALAARPFPRRAVLGAGFAGLVAVSFFINYRGANTWAVYRWNNVPVDVDTEPSRLWDWGDLQFLREMRKPAAPARLPERPAGERPWDVIAVRAPALAAHSCSSGKAAAGAVDASPTLLAERAPAELRGRRHRRHADRAHEDAGPLLAEKPARERTEERGRVHADPVEARPPGERAALGMLADHAERKHPPRQPEAEEHASGHEEREGAETNRPGPETEQARHDRQHEPAADPVGEPTDRQERRQIDDLREAEQARDAAAVQAELARAAQRDEELAHR